MNMPLSKQMGEPIESSKDKQYFHTPNRTNAKYSRLNNEPK
jgi:hypothetical protein